MTPVTLCPCGCGGTVKRGNRYAKSGCFSKASRSAPRPRQARTPDAYTIQPDTRPKDDAPTSWWIQADRATFAGLLRTHQERIQGSRFSGYQDMTLAAESKRRPLSFAARQEVL